MVRVGRDAPLGNERQLPGHQTQIYSPTTRRMRCPRLVGRAGCGPSVHSTPPVGSPWSTIMLDSVFKIRRRSAVHCSRRSVGRMADETRVTVDADETRSLVRPHRQTQARQIHAPISGTGTVRAALPVGRLGCCPRRTKSAVRERGRIMESTVARSGRAARCDCRKELSERSARQATGMHCIARRQSTMKGTTAFRKDAGHLSAANPDVSARTTSGMESGQCHTRNQP